jgi:hypothetical protein
MNKVLIAIALVAGVAFSAVDTGDNCSKLRTYERKVGWHVYKAHTEADLAQMCLLDKEFGCYGIALKAMEKADIADGKWINFKIRAKIY